MDDIEMDTRWCRWCRVAFTLPSGMCYCPACGQKTEVALPKNYIVIPPDLEFDGRCQKVKPVDASGNDGKLEVVRHSPRIWKDDDVERNEG